MSASTGTVTEIARAKINLTLHVGRAIPDGHFKGYHPVNSLVVFADFGDRLVFTPAAEPDFEITGPFANGLETNSDNLVSRALRSSGARSQSVRLEKNIPISAGLGGGSANAAAVLRWFDPEGRIEGASLGADVPVCRLSQTALMQGIGEEITVLPNLGQLSAVLVNPLVPVSTAAIFTAFDSEAREELPRQNSGEASLLQRALDGRNDLQQIAGKLVPDIEVVIGAISEQQGCQLARMSGSGASCYGLFESDDAAAAAADIIKNTHPEWWVRPCRLGDAP